MRYDTPVYFRTITQGAYDPETGDYEDDVPTEELLYASVTSSGVDTLNLVYGGLRQGSLTVRLQNHYSKPFENIRIGQTLYRVDFSRPLRSKQTFVVSEVPGNAQYQN